MSSGLIKYALHSITKSKEHPHLQISRLIRVPLTTIRGMFEFFPLLLNQNKETLDNSARIKRAIDWLLYSQIKTNMKGYSSKYSLITGWDDSYPETTGYIIPTMIRYYNLSKDERVMDSIKNAGEWLLSIQQKDGSFLGVKSDRKMVFDTGQIIFGLLALHNLLDNKKYLNAAVKAGDWIVSVQEKDGNWIKYAYNEIPHTYYTMVSWALMELWKTTSMKKYKDPAIRHLDWTLKQQKENGWFDHMAFMVDEYPTLHTIMYVIEGLLECYRISQEERFWGGARKTADKLLDISENKEFILSNRYDKDWTPKSGSKNIPGLAQLCLCWLKLFKVTGDKRYLIEAVKTLEYVKSKQVFYTKDKNIDGGIPAVYPLFGDYIPFSFVNWGAKFFIDALIELEKIKREAGEKTLTIIEGGLENYIGKRFDFLCANRIAASGLIYKIATDRLTKHDMQVVEALDKYLLGKGKRLLDAGCGMGKFSYYYASKGIDVYGMDISESLLEFARGKNYLPNIKYEIGSISKIPYPDDFFDAAIAIEVLQHVPNLVKALRELERVVKDGGNVLIVDREPRSMLGLFGLKSLLEKVGKWMYPTDSPFKERWYSKKDWIEKISKIGLVKDIITIGKIMEPNRFNLYVVEVKNDR